jgi:multiple sugar transport system substrate-binding protein
MLTHSLLTRRNFTRLSLFGLGIGLANCSAPAQLSSFNSVNASSEADLTIWWEQGFLPEENEQVIQLVQDWEQQTGLKVNLKLLPIALIDQQLSGLITEPDNTQLPDIVYAIGVDASLAPKLAWRDQLLGTSKNRKLSCE